MTTTQLNALDLEARARELMTMIKNTDATSGTRLCDENRYAAIYEALLYLARDTEKGLSK